MEMELKGGAHGVEVGADGRRIPVAEIRSRGLTAVGRKILAERAEDDRAGRSHRSLNPTEERALTLASAGGVAGQPQPDTPAPAPEPAPAAPVPPPAEPEPAPAAAGASEGDLRTQSLRLSVEAEAAALGRRAPKA